jgi:hypothetical protein
MEDILKRTNILTIGKSYSLNFLALVFMYVTPALSHMVSFPIYYFEPMRIFLIFTIVHQEKKNGYILALTLPLFAFITSSHPVFLKTLLITSELSLNVFLFYLLRNKIKNVFLVVVLSISLSKIAYYAIKFLLINTSLLNSGLVSTPMLIQIGTVLVLSGYAYFFLSKNKS